MQPSQVENNQPVLKHQNESPNNIQHPNAAYTNFSAELIPLSRPVWNYSHGSNPNPEIYGVHRGPLPRQEPSELARVQMSIKSQFYCYKYLLWILVLLAAFEIGFFVWAQVSDSDEEVSNSWWIVAIPKFLIYSFGLFIISSKQNPKYQKIFVLLTTLIMVVYIILIVIYAVNDNDDDDFSSVITSAVISGIVIPGYLTWRGYRLYKLLAQKKQLTAAVNPA